jgi:hypothetical protein
MARGDPKCSQEPKPNVITALLNETDYSSFWHLGDIAYDLHSDGGTRGDLYMKHIEPLASSRPYMTVAGNHELFRNFEHYLHHFLMPEPSLYYSVQIGAATFLVLNTELNRSNADKYKKYASFLEKSLLTYSRWLNAELHRINLNRHQVPWLIVLGHRPLYCSKNEHSEMITRVCELQAEEMRRMYEALFKLHKVDLYIAGHLHLYERTLPVYRGEVRGNYSLDDEVFVDIEAPIHVVNGVAGNLEGREIVFNVTETPNNFTAVLSEALGYGRLTVHNQSHLEYTQYAFGETQFDPVEVELLPSRRVEDHFWVVKSDRRRLSDKLAE